MSFKKVEEALGNMDKLIRCSWCEDGGIMQNYHDLEWGVPVHSDQKHFEFLMMEVMQCGLNWTMMMNKREIFRECFAQFDFRKVAHFDEEKIQEILSVEKMIHSRRKIEAIIHNANLFLDIEKEFGSFDSYIWSFTEGKTYVYQDHSNGTIPAKNELSDKISKDMKKRGFKYMGSITVYSHLQASGIINDHVCQCYRYQQLLEHNPITYIER